MGSDVLVGALSHSGRFRAVFCEQMTLGHLAGAVHEILLGLGGTARVWRVDRMASAVIRGTDRLNPQFAQLAKHYGVDEQPSYMPRRGQSSLGSPFATGVCALCRGPRQQPIRVGV